MQSFIISHSSSAEQYGDMSADTQTRTHRLTHSHTFEPPTAGVQLVGHSSKIISYSLLLVVVDSTTIHYALLPSLPERSVRVMHLVCLFVCQSVRVNNYKNYCSD